MIMEAPRKACNVSDPLQLDPVVKGTTVTGCPCRVPGKPFTFTATSGYLQVVKTGPTYIISDLHAGDRGPRDSFAYGNREKEFSDFLDYVTKQNGKLIIVGDLLDCWQFNVSKVITVRLPLLDRLSSMGAVYILGNHDADLNYFAGTNLLNHSLIRNAKRGLTLVVNGKRIRLIHGHEADPYCISDIPGVGRITAILSGIAEDKHGSPMASKYKTIAQKVVGPMDRAVSHFNWLRGKPSREKQMNRALKSLACTYDVLISGHTHKAGHIGNWYYNSGTWAEFRNSFLVINQNGTVGVFDWAAGPSPNQTVLPI